MTTPDHEADEIVRERGDNLRLSLVDQVAGCFHDFDIDALGRENMRRLTKDIVRAVAAFIEHRAHTTGARERALEEALADLVDAISHSDFGYEDFILDSVKRARALLSPSQSEEGRK